MSAVPHAQVSRQFLDFFEARIARHQAMAFVAVLSTAGSSYSKTGQPLLIDEAGQIQGILSGGCLEGDLAERSLAAIRSGKADVVEYDLSADDELFGLGVGCEGAIKVLVQPLAVNDGFQPLSSIIQLLQSNGCVDVCIDMANNEASKFSLLRPQRILLLGAGPDVDPLLQMCTSLGWYLSVADHRPAYVGRLEGMQHLDLYCFPAESSATDLNLEYYDAAIVMSHNLNADRSYLQALAGSDLPFVGLLGPPHRRDRLLADIGTQADLLAGRLRAPVGRRVGGRGPQAIALEVVVELQEYFCSDDYRVLKASRSAGVSMSIAAGS